MPRQIIFNKIFDVIKENKESEKFFSSERKEERNLFPIFDLPKNSWCLIKKSKDGKWLVLFYKQSCEESEEGKESFYISFARENSSDEATFNTFKKLEEGSFDEKWMKKL